jgi:hypothetical protein
MKVRNTDTQAGVAEVLLGALGGSGVQKAVEAQEAQGQQSLVNSTQLPVDGSENEAFVQMGVTFGPIEEGKLFRDATLPDGWKKEPTDHSMWSKLVDGNSSKRAMIFYKAAFYDCSAHMSPCGRFSIETDYAYGDANPGKVRVRVFDAWGGEKTPIFSAEGEWSNEDERYRKIDALAERCSAWLAKRYPEYKSANAYWETK